MKLTPAGATLGALLTTLRSARALIVVVAVAVLLPATGSVVVLVAFAALASTVPSATLAPTCTITLMIAELPATIVLSVSLMLLPLLLSVNTALPDWLCDTNAVPLGRVSLRATLWASLGPLLLTVIV